MSLQLLIHFPETKDKIQQRSWAQDPSDVSWQRPACSPRGINRPQLPALSVKLLKAPIDVLLLVNQLYGSPGLTRLTSPPDPEPWVYSKCIKKMML